MIKFINYISAIRNQLIVLGFVFLFKILVGLDILPNESYFINLLNNFFTNYGAWAVVVASFFENIIGIGSYFPGSIVILTSMALTAGNINRAMLTFACIVLPSTLSHCINYFFGRKISKYSLSSDKNIYLFLATTLWHPHFAAVSTFTMGGQKIPFKKFLLYFFPIHLCWNIFWGLLMYNLGKLGQTNYSFFNLFYFYISIWILWDIYKVYKDQNKK